MSNVLGAVATALFEALHPLKEALQDPGAFVQLLRDLGWDGEVTADALAGIDAAATVADVITRGETLVESLQDSGTDASTITELLALTEDLLIATASLRDVDGSALNASLANGELWSDLAAALPGHLVIDYLEDQVPALFGVLRLLGVIRDVDTGRGTSRQELDWSSLAAALTDPVDRLRDVYGWRAGSEFHHGDLLAELALLASSLGVRVRSGPVRETIRQRFFGGDEGAAADVDELGFPFVSGFVSGAFVDIGLLLAPVPSTVGGSVDGVYLTNLTWGNASVSLPVSDEWSLVVKGSMDGTGDAGIRLHPDSIVLEDVPSDAEVTLSLVGAPSAPWELLGGLIKVGGLELSATFGGDTTAPELRLAITTAGAAFVLDPGDGDAFLRHLIGSESVRLAFDPSLTWSNQTGLTLSGELGLEVTVPIDKTLGIVTVHDLHLVLEGKDGVSRLQVDVSGTADIGPLAVSVGGLGAALEMVPQPDGDTGGAFGGLDVAVSLVPPTRFGIDLDAGVVSGSGYLDIDADAGRYSGALAIDFSTLELTAIGILTTRMPDGSDGWSLFLSLSATFDMVQIGFGFTLEGVGGLIGVNRSMDTDALQDGIRAGSLDAVLFPDDPVADAALIISELDAIFPAASGQYVFGPMGRIGWGTPTLVTADVGIVIQLPDPVVVAILGSVSTVLPSEETPLVELHLDVAGVIDFDEGSIAIDASLRDSTIVGFTLSGDMALRADFIGTPEFLLAIGGFHPRFCPPSDFPSLGRLTVGIDAGGLIQVELRSYLALTANTVQLGAHLEMSAKIEGFGVEGELGFDALVTFSPFAFIVDVEFEVAVTGRIAGKDFDIASVRVEGSLGGPNPWTLVGTATFTVLGLDQDLGIDETFGSKEESDRAESADELFAKVVGEFESDDAWAEVLEDAAATVVQLLEEASDDMLVHPAGSLEVREKLVPLGMTIDRYGNYDPGPVRTFELSEVSLGGASTSVSSVEVDDWFAPAQYFDLSEEEKLSSPSFERMVCGVRFGDDAAEAGAEHLLELGYEQRVLDPFNDEEPTSLTKLYHPSQEVVEQWSFNGGAARVRRSRPGRSRFQASASPYAIEETRYVVADLDRASRVDDVTPSSVTYAAARLALSGSSIGDLQIIPSHEAGGGT